MKNYSIFIEVLLTVVFFGIIKQYMGRYIKMGTGMPNGPVPKSVQIISFMRKPSNIYLSMSSLPLKAPWHSCQ